jgi:Trypsin-like peptidase domain
MVSMWSDRLAEVWASPDRAGAGVVVGEDGVLTARHVVAEALENAGMRVLARVVRPGDSVADWAPMTVNWHDARWDLALLTRDKRSRGKGSWVPPRSSEPVVVTVGLGVERDCEAVGFPDSAVQLTGGGDPARNVRQSEQVVGTVSPAGQGKPPVDPRRRLPARWLPFDVETAAPEAQAGWDGMSGAGVILPDGRLIGIVVTSESKHEERRLYLVPLAAALSQLPAFAQRVAEVVGQQLVVQARTAPLYERVCEKASWGKMACLCRSARSRILGSSA